MNGTNPSDRDINTLVGRICTLAHDWNEGGKPLDQEQIKACILAWHQYQRESDARRAAEIIMQGSDSFGVIPAYPLASRKMVELEIAAIIGGYESLFRHIQSNSGKESTHERK